MKILILLLLSLPAFAQQYTYSKVTFDFFPADSTVPFFSRSVTQPVTVIIDTVKKQITIPSCQVYSNSTTRRNLLTDFVTTVNDTTLIVSGATTIQMVIPYINVSSDGYAKGYFLSGKMHGLLFPDHFFIIYPLWAKYYRVIEFK